MGDHAEGSHEVSLAQPRGTQGSDGQYQQREWPCQEEQAQKAVEARHMVENNQDLLAQVFGDRKLQANKLILAVIDSHVRSLCPHGQVVCGRPAVLCWTIAVRPVTHDARMQHARKNLKVLWFARSDIRPIC